MRTKRILSGIRTTGALHLGHYFGALKSWVELQNSGQYECFFLLADVQALTTHFRKVAEMQKSTFEVALGGVKSSRTTIMSDLMARWRSIDILGVNMIFL